MRVPLARGIHSADIAFRLAQGLGVTDTLESFARAMTTPPAATSRALRIRNALPPGSLTMTLHADTVQARRWRPEHWGKTIDAVITACPNLYIFVVGMHGAVNEASMRHERVISSLGADLQLSFALVAGSDVFAGINSCMLHVADVAGVPGVGLFENALAEAEWGFRYTRHRHVVAEHAMNDIQPETVVRALLDLAEEVRP